MREKLALLSLAALLPVLASAEDEHAMASLISFVQLVALLPALAACAVIYATVPAKDRRLYASVCLVAAAPLSNGHGYWPLLLGVFFGAFSTPELMRAGLASVVATPIVAYVTLAIIERTFAFLMGVIRRTRNDKT